MPDANATLPYPPLDLMHRVGSLHGVPDPEARFDQLGAGAKRSIVGALPEGWSWEGARVLDFGCGAGRTLRHLVDEAVVAEIHGCDIDTDSIAWLDEHLVPPLAGVDASGPAPPLPYADDSFDLVYAVSVFTHLSELWAPWLCEMHRVLAPGGLLVATFLGQGVAESINGEPWDERRIGISIGNDGQSWDLGGPMVVHSPWWLRSHWGRLFTIDHIETHGFGESDPASPKGHGIVVARKDERAPVGPEELAAPDPDDPAELHALDCEVQRRLQEIRWLRADADHLRAQLAAASAGAPAGASDRAEVEAVAAARDALREQRDGLETRIAALESSTSWKVTAPLRKASDAWRARAKR